MIDKYIITKYADRNELFIRSVDEIINKFPEYNFDILTKFETGNRASDIALIRQLKKGLIKIEELM